MSQWLPLLILATSLVPALVTFFLDQDQHRLRNTLNLGGAVAKLGLVVYLLIDVAQGTFHEVRFDLLPGQFLLLRVDALALLFLTLSALLWLLTTIYAIAYFHRKPNLSRFFGFFGLCVFATTGIALAGSLLTFFVFYELLTLSTCPLVVHKQNPESMAAGRTYLRYAMPSSAVLLLAILWLQHLAGPIEFTGGPELAGLDPDTLRVIFVLFVIGLGMKAAVVPLHGWLPAAMAAPAPVSALLHAVAVVKAGAFGFVRVIHDVFGIEQVTALSLGLPLAVLASVTIIYGSLKALGQRGIKRRLAFSTVSQVSYILLGVALAAPFALIGGLAHLVHQGLMKITLFFCAGIYDERAGIRQVDQLDGVGARMPWTSMCFSLGALGMIGLPPMAGFVTKIYLGIGGLEAGAPWVIGVLAASTLLNAAYFLPLLYRIWFVEPASADRPGERPLGIVAPAVVTGLAAIAVGLFASSAISPLAWASLIVERTYSP
jgi:multicomponent Na+:H+ antiporter subunit D